MRNSWEDSTQKMLLEKYEHLWNFGLTEGCFIMGTTSFSFSLVAGLLESLQQAPVFCF